MTQVDARPTSSDWPRKLTRMGFGGDYNPEQWPEAVWDEDVALMVEAGVTTATVGVFSWAALEPARGRFRFGWLDQVLGKLDAVGILTVLATPTAGPPAWLAREHPETLPVTRDGRTLGLGAREHFCPSSPAYRAAAAAIARELATRYADFPGLALWHIGNEFGSHVGPCYCPTSVAAFRVWLQERYGTLAATNAAWGTSFWGQAYGDWAEITAPGEAPMPSNPAQQLDFARFSSDEYLACYKSERDVIRGLTPDVPITTNFMANNCKHLDYWRWAPEVDVVSNDHYLIAEDPGRHIDLAMSADLTRGLAGGAPWMLMEHSTSAVNWQPRNLAKVSGELRRNSLAHVAHGADAAMFFQWRTSRFGAEKFHSAMLPQAGAVGRVWKEVCGLGRDLAALAEVRGTRVHADVAVMWDWQSWWALELEFRPSTDVTYLDRIRALYEATWTTGRTIDFVSPTSDLTGYRVVLLPSSYLLAPAAAANIERYVRAGGSVLVSFFSGIVDQHDAVPPGPYPGTLRDVLGLWIEEFHPLGADQLVGVEGFGDARLWSETVYADADDVVARFLAGPDAGSPAIVRHAHGAGQAWYLATGLAAAGSRALVDRVCREAGSPTPDGPTGVEVVRRHGEHHTYLFAINHTGAPVLVPGSGVDLLTGAEHAGSVPLPAGGVVVVREVSPA